MTEVKLTLEEQIDRARDGRSQSNIVQKMKDKGCDEITEVSFSRKKKGRMSFTEKELATLSEILGTQITND